MNKKLIIINVITIILLSLVIIKENYTQRLFSRIETFFGVQKDTKPYSYLDNPSYKQQCDFYSIYLDEKKIVMLGNSLTYRIDWNELLKRADVANRGIGADITEGYIHRLKYVLNLKPKICFIEGGINDLTLNIKNQTIINNLNTVIDSLEAFKIKPIINTVLYVAKKYENAEKLNLKIKKLNSEIKKLANHRNIQVIDLIPKLTDGEFLVSENAVGDGIHLSYKSYSVWGDEIEKVLKSNKL